MMSADSLGVTPLDTGEFLLGTVTVTPVLFESNGQIDPSTQDWTEAEIQETLDRVREGVDWWVESLARLNTVHTLEFQIDETFARTPVETPYEPIDRPNQALDLYVGDWVTEQGYGDANSIEDAVRQFNQDQRITHGTDWAFTIFIADSSDDADGLFASGGNFAGAFAFPGGLFMVTPSTRPASTITHELGHIFWARDEYQGGGSFTDTRGYYNTQNLNAWDNPTPGFVQQISIMRGGVPLTQAFVAHTSPASTFAQVGWQDSDGDGIFDLVDVPLALDGIGYFDADASVYRFSGQADVVPLLNRNSSGAQSDISLAEITRLEYRLDDGPWMPAQAVGSQSAFLDVEIPIEGDFDEILFRIIDADTGVTSEEVFGTRSIPALTSASIAGVAFRDTNANGVKDEGEAALSSAQITVRHADGSDLFAQTVVADEFPAGPLPSLIQRGIVVEADGVVSDTAVGSFTVSQLGDEAVFHSFDLQRQDWTHRWSDRVAFEAHVDDGANDGADDGGQATVGSASVRVLGLSETSYGRLEAYDALGELIARDTSGPIGVAESATLEVSDPEGRIASIRVFGHADTSIAIAEFSLGSPGEFQTDVSGGWQLANLPSGQYEVSFESASVVDAFETPQIIVSVADGTSPLVMAATTRVDSHRHNADFAQDANGDGSVTASDALVIINDLSRNQPRTLTADDLGPFDVDVTNDGVVSALDALQVINWLSRNASGQGGEGEFVRDGIFADWQSDSQGSSDQSLPVDQPENFAKTRQKFNFSDGRTVVGRGSWLRSGGFGELAGRELDSHSDDHPSAGSLLGDLHGGDGSKWDT